MSAEKLSPLDRLIEEWGKLVGNIITSEEQRAKAPITTNNYLTRTASADLIRIFVDGEGDLNPLYRDPEYAKNTKYKCIIGPQTIFTLLVMPNIPKAVFPLYPA